MEDLFADDRISLTFDDIPCDEITATIARTLSDTEEGLGRRRSKTIFVTG